jgi:hypothetical protein
VTTLDARSERAVLLGQPGLPDVRRLHDVVVDADDLRELRVHRVRPFVYWNSCRR